MQWIVHEVRYGNSSFDLVFEVGGNKCFLVVKGVTLEREGVIVTALKMDNILDIELIPGALQ